MEQIWQVKDRKYATTIPLGPIFKSSGQLSMRLWAPTADEVIIELYDKDNLEHLIHEVSLTYMGEGVWESNLSEIGHNLTLEGCGYSYRVKRNGQEKRILDPYARSLAAFSSMQGESTVPKAIIVNPDRIGPVTDYARILTFKKREDAIIYETHVRDMTSDSRLANELKEPFGTYEAMISTLDYIKELGVTHIQLLPVLGFMNADEIANRERVMEYAVESVNYNWGYDPLSYFSLTGMYSSQPADPYSRIEEFKRLVKAIHDRGMGVILDVVYNHTASVHILEDIEPNYYHFMNQDGNTRTSFGGGRLGTTHAMSRRIVIDSLIYLSETYKVDGFRFDMMGDLDATTLTLAYEQLRAINPSILMIGEGWRTYIGDEGKADVIPADQDWMAKTQAVASFSDEMRNELKSGYPREGYPRFITGGRRPIQKIISNLKGQPTNFIADQPGDVVQYIEAHDNLTLHDSIVQAIKKDPMEAREEIHARIRLGNLLVLTSQGIAFLHAGQEYGRTKQFKHPDYLVEVSKGLRHSTLMRDKHGTPLSYPYFVHDSYNASDAVNRFEWDKVRGTEGYEIEHQTVAYTRGLIALRHSSDAFRLGDKQLINRNVRLVEIDSVKERDTGIIYQLLGTSGDCYMVVINGSLRKRQFHLPMHLGSATIIVDQKEVNLDGIQKPSGIGFRTDNLIELDKLTAVVFRWYK